MTGPDEAGPVAAPFGVALFNVRYSPNLGDGLLAACLEAGLGQALPGVRAWSIDLAARDHHAVGEATGRGLQLRVLRALPGPMRRASVAVVQTRQARRRWRPHYRRVLEGAQAAVIGGGALITDLDLNFPRKIAVATEIAAEAGLPVAIYGVGVGRRFSPAGLDLFRRAFGRVDLAGVQVRDEASRLSWNRHFAEACGREAEVVRDPGLLCPRVWPAPGDGTPPGEVAIGVISPIELAYHGAGTFDGRRLAAWYRDLVAAVARRDRRCRLFTNGSPEDTRFLRRIEPTLARAAGPRGLTTVVPRHPGELATLAASAGVVVAFRLHAVIAAVAYGTPAVSLAWDPKVEAFARSIDRETRHLDPRRTDPESAAACAVRALEQGPERVLAERLIAETASQIEALGRSLRPAREAAADARRLEVVA